MFIININTCFQDIYVRVYIYDQNYIVYDMCKFFISRFVQYTCLNLNM